MIIEEEKIIVVKMKKIIFTMKMMLMIVVVWCCEELLSGIATFCKTLITTFPSHLSKGNKSQFWSLWSWNRLRWWWCWWDAAQSLWIIVSLCVFCILCEETCAKEYGSCLEQPVQRCQSWLSSGFFCLCIFNGICIYTYEENSSVEKWIWVVFGATSGGC